MIKRQPDTERSISPERTKSPNESAYSTPVGTQCQEWRETPVAEAMTQRNSKGKLVCPIPDCWKQYVDEAQLGKHLLKEHSKDIALKDKKTIKGMIPSPHARANSPNEMDYSYSLPSIKSPVVFEWRNTPIAKAVLEKNAVGKLVCPFPNWGKQYVGILQLGKNMMKDHYKELSVRDKKKDYWNDLHPSQKIKKKLEALLLHFRSHLLKYDFQPVKLNQRAQQKGIPPMLT